MAYLFSAGEPLHACDCVPVCVNGKSLRLCISHSVAFRLHMFGQHAESMYRPLFKNTLAAVYHTGGGVEDSSLPGPRAAVSADALSRLVNMFSKGNPPGGRCR